ncbi:MAG: hypothetical protein SVM80_13745 [Halobacteriota archaeon]|nr:hypothetical protein [Halobacteriota archaeon]
MKRDERTLQWMHYEYIWQHFTGSCAPGEYSGVIEASQAQT